jgi:hypothetical protein
MKFRNRIEVTANDLGESEGRSSHGCLQEGNMERHLAIVLVVGAFGGLIALTNSCFAQTVILQDPMQNQSPQSPQNPQANQVQPLVPRLGVPGSIITPLTTPGLKSIPLTSGAGRPSSIAGRGLPGMPGGPPLKAPMGAQDSSASYMRPPVIGPLFCDPSINIPC